MQKCPGDMQGAWRNIQYLLQMAYKEYGGMGVSQAKRLKELERENSRLKRAVADLTLDNLILKESSEGNF